MSSYNPPTDIRHIILSHNLTIPTIINGLLEGGHHELRDNLIGNIPTVLDAFYRHQPDLVFHWAFELVSQRLQSELITLTQHQHGLYFNLHQATATSIQAPFMQDIAKKMKDVTPQLWALMQTLLDARRDSRRSRGLNRESSEKEAIKRLGRKAEAGRLQDLGEGAEPEDVDSDVEMDDGTGNKPTKGNGKDQVLLQNGPGSTVLRNNALMVIVCVSSCGKDKFDILMNARNPSFASQSCFKTPTRGATMFKAFLGCFFTPLPYQKRPKNFFHMPGYQSVYHLSMPLSNRYQRKQVRSYGNRSVL